MEIEYVLAGSHPKFAPLIREAFDRLSAKYPVSNLKRVVLFCPEAGDESMGYASADGEVGLNLHWFGRDPLVLSEAAASRPIIDVGGVEMGWHGPMLSEPEQLFAHEFFHTVWYGMPQGRAERWATERWRLATRDVKLAPSGYSLANPSEFFAEFGALVELGFATPTESADLMELMRS